MKILVTVGTTRFSSLTEKARTIGAHDMTLQHADPSLSFGHVFLDNIEQHYQDADLVITHAGAGSVFSLLEMGKKIIVVPNLERVDKHQLDLAQHVERNGYALVAWEIESLRRCIDDSTNFSPNTYSPTKFFKFEEITEFIYR
ncbi:PssE/Cps14G family polysaccharide biosynthesis glycosyltransferase [Aliagarivorans taiwanensis]|uniref:PssE/Cps14G family polysaccharide biosynthesis glycosyltransferase n=1 Tax=Aliagarivorans taiwanensis TaxID=561966 RepID=UPI0004793AF6|nr:PssE/Cps14G family polysaccharide biosynthesis glycosyltransferase [Aliagarivorans taiwanensis]